MELQLGEFQRPPQPPGVVIVRRPAARLLQPALRRWTSRADGSNTKTCPRSNTAETLTFGVRSSLARMATRLVVSNEVGIP